MGKGERSCAETQAHNISSRQKENRGGTKGTVGEVQGGEEEDCLEPASLLRVPAMKVTLEDGLSLLSKYAEERTPVRAVLGSPSVSVARVVGLIRVSIAGGVPHLLIGKDDSESDQIKFRLSDCEFAYGDFRDEESVGVQLLPLKRRRWLYATTFFTSG